MPQAAAAPAQRSRHRAPRQRPRAPSRGAHLAPPRAAGFGPGRTRPCAAPQGPLLRAAFGRGHPQRHQAVAPQVIRNLVSPVFLSTKAGCIDVKPSSTSRVERPACGSGRPFLVCCASVHDASRINNRCSARSHLLVAVPVAPWKAAHHTHSTTTQQYNPGRETS